MSFGRWRTFLQGFGSVGPGVKRARAPAGTFGRWWRGVFLVLCSLAWGPLPAHELRPLIASVTVAPDGLVGVEISLALEAAMAGMGAEHGASADAPEVREYERLRGLSADELRVAFGTVAASLVDAISLGTQTGRLVLLLDAVEVPEVGDTGLPRLSRLRLHGAQPAGGSELTWRLAPALGDSVVRWRKADRPEVLGAEFLPAGTVSKSFPLADRQSAAPAPSLTSYLQLGFTHIVPKGLDHILFVVGLFLASIRISALLWQVTAFTVAHTATLALGMLGIVTLSPRVVEPLIAASILYVAVEAIAHRQLRCGRLAVVFAFGLLHGLGFAGVLKEFDLPPAEFVLGLLSFNLGVELGQLSVIGGCFALLGWGMRKDWYRSVVVLPASVLIAAVGAFWFGQRVGWV